jgi:hypothetical protein
MTKISGIPYCLRFDNEFTCILDEDYLKFFLGTFLEGSFDKWLFGMENKSDGTPHFQGIAWTKEKFDKKKTNLLRSQIRLQLVGPPYQGKGSYAFTLATTPASLAKYCNDKERKGVYTNLTDEEREEIGEWVDKDIKKKNLKKELEVHIQQVGKDVGSQNVTRRQFVNKIVDIYVGIYHNLPRATQVEKWLYLYASNNEEKDRMRRDKYSHIFSGITRSLEYDEHNNNYEEEHGVANFFD